MTYSYQLKTRSLVRFSGDEAADFLNDLITADTAAIAPHTVQQGMLLTPQGRILYDLLISRDGEDLLLEVDAERQAEFIKKMMMYRLRRPVSITPDDQAVHVVFDASDDDGDNTGLADPRFGGTARRYYGDRDDQNGDDRDYQAFRYRHGVAEGGHDLPPEKALPLEARLDLDQGISFEKGCYIGQEVTARTRYRGLVKRSYMPVRVDDDGGQKTHLLNSDYPQDITLDEKLVGQAMGMAEDDDGLIGLASIRLEAINGAAQGDADLTMDGARLTPLFPERLMPLPAKKD